MFDALAEEAKTIFAQQKKARKDLIEKVLAEDEAEQALTPVEMIVDPITSDSSGDNEHSDEEKDSQASAKKKTNRKDTPGKSKKRARTKKKKNRKKTATKVKKEPDTTEKQSKRKETPAKSKKTDEQVLADHDWHQELSVLFCMLSYVAGQKITQK